jgi:hypothetical protein
VTWSEPRQLRSARAARLPLAPPVPDVSVLAPIDEELPVEPLVDGLVAALPEGLAADEELLEDGVVVEDAPEAPIELLEPGSDDVDGPGLAAGALLEPEGEAPIVLEEPEVPGLWLAPVVGCEPPVPAPAPVVADPEVAPPAAVPLPDVWATAKLPIARAAAAARVVRVVFIALMDRTPRSCPSKGLWNDAGRGAGWSKD